MAETLQEIGGMAIADHLHRDGDYGMDGKAAYEARKAEFDGQSAAVLAALRDPPPEVIEAGAKEMWNAVADEHNKWGALGEDERVTQRSSWLASWRAALNAGS